MVKFSRDSTPSTLYLKGFWLGALHLFNPFASFWAIATMPPARHSTPTTLWYSLSTVATTAIHMIADTRQRELRCMTG